MANATGTPQSALYRTRGQSDGNSTRNRSAEQQYSGNSGNPMNYLQQMNGQDPSLARYVPPMLASRNPTSASWQNNNNNQGGYAYNIPTQFGGFGGFSQFSQQGGPGGAQAPQGQQVPPAQTMQAPTQEAEAVRQITGARQLQNNSFGRGERTTPTYDSLMGMLRGNAARSNLNSQQLPVEGAMGRLAGAYR